jgi:hypothetical protein
MKRVIYFSIIVSFLLISCQSFTDDTENKIDYPSRIYNFLNEGFGCQFASHKVYGYDILSKFGEIKNISLNKNYMNNDFVVIEFNSIVLHLYGKEALELYYNDKLNGDTLRNFRIYGINAKENIEYLYGIKIGMSFQEFISIIGEKTTNKRDDAYFLPSPEDYLDKNEPIEEVYLNNIPIVIFPPQKPYYWRNKVEYAFVMFKENKIAYIRWVF